MAGQDCTATTVVSLFGRFANGWRHGGSHVAQQRESHHSTVQGYAGFGVDVQAAALAIEVV